MQTENELLESLKCPVCIDFAVDPMECLSCSNIFCNNCINNGTSSIKLKACPICRKPPNFRESAFAKRLLGNMPVICPNECGSTLSKNELKNHLDKCTNKKLICLLCNFEGKKEDFLQHLIFKHDDDLIKKYDKNTKITPIETLTKPANQPLFPMFGSSLSTNSSNLFAPPQINMFQQQINAVSNNMNNCMNSVLRSNSSINFNPHSNLFLPNTSNINFNDNNSSLNKFNSKGKFVNIGENNIYYCSQKLDFNCGCCDGKCGPTDGCCCLSCMDYNCKIKNLPPGVLINKKGLTCKWKRCAFFCGCEYVKESNNIFGKIFQKRNKCEYPNESCSECLKITSNVKFYLSQEQLTNMYTQNK